MTTRDGATLRIVVGRCAGDRYRGMPETTGSTQEQALATNDRTVPDSGGTQTASHRRPRVLALSSTGGHWVQLLRLYPVFDGCELHLATTTGDFRQRVAQMSQARGEPVPGYHVFTDANRWQKLRLVRQMLEIAALVLRLRPDVIITTGASCGYFALRAGRLVGARGCWLDSIANAQVLSLSGIKSGPYADLWLTQWPELAQDGGPLFKGAVL